MTEREIELTIEVSQLRARVAQLEGIIQEYEKNKRGN